MDRSKLTQQYSSERRAQSARELERRWQDPEYRAQRLDLVAPLVSCRYCDREMRGKSNLTRHEQICKQNPDRPLKPRPSDAKKRDTDPEHSFIYGMLDLRNREMRYVGWTANLSRRRKGHLKAARNGKENSYLLYWLRDMLKDGVEPQMVILETDPPNWREAEQAWIKRYRSWGCRLTNLTDGGDGAMGYRHTEENKERLRELQQQQFATKTGPYSSEANLKKSLAGKGRIATPETRIKLSQALTGRPRSASHAAAISAAKTGVKQSPEHAAKSREIGRAALIKLNKSLEHRARISARVKTPEEIEKIRRGLTGQKRSLEQRANMSKAKRGVPVGTSKQVVCERCGETIYARGVAPHLRGCRNQ